MRFFLRLILNAAALLGIARVIAGITIDGFTTALFAALVLALANAVVRPILVLLSLPITLLTLGLFLLVINALLFWGVSAVVDGFGVSGMSAAFLGALLMSIVGWVTSTFLKKKKDA